MNTPRHDWKALVVRHAHATGADGLGRHTIDELAAHLEDLYLEARASGRSERDAYAMAERALLESALATVPRSRTRAPESRPALAEPPSRGLTGVGADVRFALRQLRRAPAFAAVAIATLGLGAGAATAIFSVIDTVLLRPLPFREPHQLVAIWEGNAVKALPKERLSPVNFMDYRGVQSSFADAAAWWRPEVNLTRPDSEPVRVSAIEVSGNLFDLLGVSPQLGPGFPQHGPFYSRDPLAVISNRLWHQRYAADPGIVGRRLDSKDGNYIIVGVMPAGFDFPADVDLWLRLTWDLTQHSRGAHFMEAVGRLKPGVTAEQASRELASVSARLAAANAATNRDWMARAVPLLDDMLGYYRPALFVLLGAVGLLLVTACLNVASLLLARATVRAREMAVRAALGASRMRLVRQVLIESLVLAAAGTVAGGLSALGLLRIAIAALPASVPRLAQTTIDLRLLAFALAVVAGTAILFGVVPALVLSRTQASEALKDGTRTATSARGRRWNRVLVVVEVALACTVLVASALLVRSVSRMIHAPTGVSSHGVVTGTLQLSSSGYPTWPNVDQFYASLLDAVRRQPGVESAGAATALPLDAGWRLPFDVDGRPAAREDERPIAQHVAITSGYFEALRAQLIAGRWLTDRDTASAEPVIVVNQTFARRAFPGEEAVGRRIVSTARYIGPLGRNLLEAGPFRIVGVVADIHQAPLDQPDEPVIYHSARQFPFRAMTLVARGGDEASVIAALRSGLRALDPSLPLSNVRTMDDRLLARTAAPRLLMFVLVAFAILTVTLAVIGVYGLLACLVNERRRELAIRLALGAQPVALARLVTTQGLGFWMGGFLLGLVPAHLAGGWLRGVLFETRRSDVGGMGRGSGFLLAAAAVACLAPARRAARVARSEGLKDHG